jgi:hypothetical protein
MNCLAIVGFSSLGVVIGLLVGMFANSEEAPEAKAYSAIILAIGSSAATFIPLFAAQSNKEMWFYPVAMLVGFILTPPWEFITTWFYSRPYIVKIYKAYEEAYPDK